MPGLGGGDRLAHAHAAEGADLRGELRRGEVAAQDRLVADHQQVDVAGPGGDRQPAQLRRVARLAVQPGAQGDPQVEPLLAGQRRDAVEAAVHRIGADPAGQRRDGAEVAGDLLGGRPVPGLAALAALVGGEGEAGDRAAPVGQGGRAVPGEPGGAMQRRDQQQGAERGQAAPGRLWARGGWSVGRGNGAGGHGSNAPAGSGAGVAPEAMPMKRPGQGAIRPAAWRDCGGAILSRCCDAGLPATAGRSPDVEGLRGWGLCA